MKMKMGLATMRWLVMISLCLTLSSCNKLDGSDRWDIQGDCPPGQYWAINDCQPCNQCRNGQFQLSRCSATENAVCITCQQYKIGMQCLSQFRGKRLWRLRKGKPLRTRLFDDQQHPCYALDAQLLRQLDTKKRSKTDRLWSSCRRIRIAKRETTATELVTKGSRGFATTTTPTPVSTTDDLEMRKSFAHGFLAPNLPEIGSRSSNEGGKRRRKPIRNHVSKTKKERNQPSFQDIPIERNSEEYETFDQQIVPSVSGTSKKDNSPTNGAFPPTMNPGRIGEKNVFTINNEDFGSKDTKISSIETDEPSSPPSSSSSSSSSWWLDHSEWLYSLMAAGVVILALSVFIASRLHMRGKPRTRPVAKNLKVNVENDPNQGEKKGDSLEMDDFEDNISNGSPASPPDISKSRNLLSYESDTNLAQNNKFLLSHSQSSTLEMNSKANDSLIATLKSTASLSRMDWLAKANDFNSHNDYGSYHSEAETQTDGETVAHNSKTVFDTKWQFSGTFSREGGVLQRDNSDVSLVVGRDAVSLGQYVTIHGAVFTDATEIRSKFDIGSDEMLITPLVEYHAEGSYHFQHHVAVKLPHALPDDFDASFIKFYTFTVDDCGNVLLESLPMKSKDNTNVDSADAFWEICNQGRSFVAKTKHFSGYFCTTCESKSKLPSVYARVFGSHIQIKSSRREVRLILYLWDRRLNIKDFIEAICQQECDMDRQLLADEPVPLLDNATSDSSIVMRMETLGDPEDQKLWQHVTRSNASRPLFRPLQVRKLRQIVLCCQQNNPMRVEWAMENVPDVTFPSSVFQCLIEMVHVPEGVTNYEEALQDAEEENIRTFYVRNLKMAQTAHVTSEDVQSRQDLLKKTITHILNRRDMEGICQAFGMNKKDIGNLCRKFDSDDALKTGLLDECSKKCGVDHFLQALPQVLKQTQLYHVIEYLKDRDLLSTLSNCKQQGCGSIGSSIQQSPVCLRQYSESTLCKSVSQPQFELESRQQQSGLVPSNSCNSSSSMNGCGASPNRLHLQIHPGPTGAVAKEDFVLVSPDSDYNSPSSSPPGYHFKNHHGKTQDSHIVNISQVNVSSSHNNRSSSHNCNNNVDISRVSATTADYNNYDTSVPDCPSSNRNSSYSNSNNCSVSDDSDFDDSCQARIDSTDLQERINMTSMPDESCYSEETSRKELEVLGQQPTEAKDVAYPEIPEEQLVSRNAPGAISKTAANCGHSDNKESNKVPLRPLNGSREEMRDDTFIKETFI